MELGEKLRLARLEAGLSQRQLCGDQITRNMLSLIENGTASPSMHTLQYLAERLGKPVAYFLEEAAVSENQERILQATDAYGQGDYSRALELLEAYRAPDPVFDPQWYRLRTLLLLKLAEQALEENRIPYATQLLRQAEEVGCASGDDDGETRRRRLLLQARAEPENICRIVAELPSIDEELLLRAQAAQKAGDPAQSIRYLDAVEAQNTARWYVLRGEAALQMGDSWGAIGCFTRAEKEMPELCCEKLEQCYEKLEDYKMAYHYARKRQTR